MKTLRLHRALVVLVLLGLLTSLCSSGANLGDPAPGLAVERWIKGTPPAGTNITVLEFWATWCGPCKESIPRLNELHRKYAGKGVVIIGISDEPPAKVASFVAAQGDGMSYRVGVDTSRRTFRAYMTAYGQSGIPHAFIIDRFGRVMWHGFPNSNLEVSLEQILSGKFDVVKARYVDVGDRAIDQYETLVNSGRNKEKANAMAEKILSEYAKDWRVPHRLARLILTDQKLRARDYPLALKASTMAVEMTKEQSADALDMQARAFYVSGRKTEALATQKKALTVCRDPADKPDMEKRLAVYEK